MMSDAVKLAQEYFELSNQGKLADIKQLFTPLSTYRSAKTGFYLGTDDIMAMQTAFFASYKRLHWQVHSVKEVRSGIVLFDFTFTGTSVGGEAVTRSGLEHVIVYQGKIQHIDVSYHNS